jgi:hypothetical protein
MAAVRYADLSMAFDFVSDASPMEHDAYVSLDTGKVYWISDFDDTFDEDRPDDLGTSDRYLAIPHKNELDLGRSLALICRTRIAHELRPGRRIFPTTRGVWAFQRSAGS